MMGRLTFQQVLLIALAASFLLPVANPIRAQEQPRLPVITNLNLRDGPGTEHAVVAVIPARTLVTVQGRNRTGDWVRVRLLDESGGGWVASRYLIWPRGISIAGQPVIQNAPITVALHEPSLSELPPPDSPHEADLIDFLMAVPIIPPVTDRSREIFQAGQLLGNRPDVFAKVGDCNTASQGFMVLVGLGQYDLGPYAALQETIDYFSPALADGRTSFTHESLAGRSGNTSALVLDALFTDPVVCGTMALLPCEYDRVHPSIALIMFGQNDVHALNIEQFDAAMRGVIQATIDRGVIPVVTTFPSDPMENSKWLTILEMNARLVNLAQEYDVPLLNLWRAARALPHNGVDDDLLHVVHNTNDWILFTGDEYRYGFTLWNLIALQTLDLYRRELLS